MPDQPHRFPLETVDQPGPRPVTPPQRPPAPVALGPPASREELEMRIIDVLKSCYDPELPLDIYRLGLVYALEITGDYAVVIRMTLTSPACPVAGSLPAEIQQKIAAIPGVKSVKVELVWDPPWDPSRLSDEARFQLGIDF